MHKILVLTSTFPRWIGDSEPPFVFELCKQLGKEFDVYVLAPHCKGSLINEYMQGIKVIRYRYFFEDYENLCYQGGMLANLKRQPLRYLLIPVFLISQLIATYKLISKENITFIHAHWIIPQAMTACILRFVICFRLKILCTSHGGDLYSLKGKLARLIKRIVLQSVDGITVVNPVMAKEVYALCSKLSAPISVIPMGVDVQRFSPKLEKQKPFSLLFVGRLVEKKGLTFLIHAMPEIVKKFPKTLLSIIGTGPLKEECEFLVRKNHVNGNVVFLGSIPNTELPQYYQKHQIAIFPFVVAENGDREGLPVVLSEAMGCGCCVITTDLPGFENVITHDVNALVVAQKNSKEISDAVLTLFSDPQKIQTLTQKSLSQIIARQSWDVIGKRFADTIHQIITTH